MCRTAPALGLGDGSWLVTASRVGVPLDLVAALTFVGARGITAGPVYPTSNSP
ncbi:hypothetical protein M2284_004473 [Rhodococcus sp. LBL1]|nr:hypothetical protein [Rhodococcus sp. LBL1]MDH6685676.1 hypothetical protein [Rhodococcus sp. LBL2]